MDIYTLTPGFLDNKVIDEFTSAVWTERYTSAGDMQLVVPATPLNYGRLATGTFVALKGSKEVMIVDSLKTEEGLLTVVGSSLVQFLNERFLWAINPDSEDDTDKIGDYTDDTKTPGEFISDLVYKWAIAPTDFTGDWAAVNLDWLLEAIPYLTLGDIDHSGDVTRLTGSVGPLYDAISQLASDNAVGISMYLDSADADGYSLKFKTYAGLDRTSDQDVNPLVRLSQVLDSISGVTEIRSSVGYKNVAYVLYKGVISEHLADPDAPDPVGFDRRVLVTDAAGQPVGHKVIRPGQYNRATTLTSPSYTVTEVSSGEEAAFRAQNAADALANHNYIAAVDGTVSSAIADYKFGQDYGLGDIIELEGPTGLLSLAQVTEFIRAQDNIGEREYPTISVISGGT